MGCGTQSFDIHSERSQDMKKKLFMMIIIMVVLFTSIGSPHAAIASGTQTQTAVQSKVAVHPELKSYWCGNEAGVFGFNTWNAFDLLKIALGVQRADANEPQVASKSPAAIPADAAPVTRKAASVKTATAPAPATSDTKRSTEVSRGGSRTITVVATGYTAAPEENYPYAGAPSYIGLPLTRGIVAVDPNVIPMGTKLYIQGYGEGIAADQGGAINGNRIDLFFDSKQEANDWGMRSVKVTIYP